MNETPLSLEEFLKLPRPTRKEDLWAWIDEFSRVPHPTGNEDPRPYIQADKDTDEVVAQLDPTPPDMPMEERIRRWCEDFERRYPDTAARARERPEDDGMSLASAPARRSLGGGARSESAAPAPEPGARR